MARALILVFILLTGTAASGQETVRFEDAFVDSTLRIDYYHIADKNEEEITLDTLVLPGSLGRESTRVDRSIRQRSLPHEYVVQRRPVLL
jgi:hypothetical protein